MFYSVGEASPIALRTDHLTGLEGRAGMTAHPIVHIEIPAHDREASASFYSALFGWEMQHHPEMQSPPVAASPGPGGGLGKIDGDNVKQGQVLIHVGTDDIDASLNRAVEL